MEFRLSQRYSFITTVHFYANGSFSMQNPESQYTRIHCVVHVKKFLIECVQKRKSKSPSPMGAVPFCKREESHYLLFHNWHVVFVNLANEFFMCFAQEVELDTFVANEQDANLSRNSQKKERQAQLMQHYWFQRLLFHLPEAPVQNKAVSILMEKMMLVFVARWFTVSSSGFATKETTNTKHKPSRKFIGPVPEAVLRWHCECGSKICVHCEQNPLLPMHIVSSNVEGGPPEPLHLWVTQVMCNVLRNRSMVSTGNE